MTTVDPRVMRRGGLSAWTLISLPCIPREQSGVWDRSAHDRVSKGSPAFFLLHSIRLLLPPKQRRKARPMILVSASGSFYLPGMAVGSILVLTFEENC